MLHVTVIGNLGSDPETRYTADGKQRVTFRMAVNQRRKDANGERIESTEWFRVSSSGYLGEFAQRLEKGNRVMVLGRCDIGRYTTRDGQPGVSFDVYATEIQSMGARVATTSDTQDADDASPAPARAPAAAGSGASSGRPAAPRGRTVATVDEDEDLPF